MQTNIEQVKSMIRALPLEDLSKLREVIDETEREKRTIKEGKQAPLKYDLERYKKSAEMDK